MRFTMGSVSCKLSAEKMSEKREVMKKRTLRGVLRLALRTLLSHFVDFDESLFETIHL